MSLLGLIVALAGADAASVPPDVLEARFAPLGRSERTYQALGPVGPFYPAAAVRRGVNGQAVIECKPAAQGRLKGCKAVSEEPKGYSFGAAARVMAGRGHVLIADEAFAPDTTVRVRVPFVLGAPAEIEP